MKCAKTRIAISGLLLAGGLSACGGEHPCLWDTTPQDRNGFTEFTDLTYTCARERESPEPPSVQAFYGNSGSTLYVRFMIMTGGSSRDVEVTIYPELPDGTYEVSNGEMVFTSEPVRGQFTFQRSRDSPMADLKDVEEGVYTSTIDVRFDFELLAIGCTVASGPELVRLVQSGPVQMCKPTLGHH
jgi:hypothetical protein